MAIDTLSAIVDAAGSHLPPAGRWRERLPGAAGAVRGLPASLSRELYFECRLAGGERIDLIVGVPVSRIAQLSVALESGAWPRISAACARVAAAAAAAGRAPAVDQLWLELDDPANAHGGAVDREPGLFLHLPRYARSPNDVAAASAALGTPDAAAAEACALAGTLPAPAAVCYVGRMYSRAGEPLRLCIGGLPPSRLLRWLGDRRWTGDADALGAWIGAGQPRRADGDPCGGLVHVDLDRGLGARVGIEYVFERRRQAGGEFPSRAWFARLVAAGLASAETCAALEQWPGWSGEALPCRPAPGIWARRINHAKATIDRGRLELKAYLYSAGYTRADGVLVRR